MNPKDALQILAVLQVQALMRACGYFPNGDATEDSTVQALSLAMKLCAQEISRQTAGKEAA